jgi:hypothetical protein
LLCRRANSYRDLIRSLAKRLAEDDPEAARIRKAVGRTIAGEPPRKGGILAALRRSPLVGADLISPDREKVTARTCDAISSGAHSREPLAHPGYTRS